MQITNGFWLAENTKETTKNQIRLELFQQQNLRKWPWFSANNNRKVKKCIYSKNPNTVKSTSFCINVLEKKEKHCQQSRGKWASETKQAT